ncbi:MAG: hypothetical protein L6R38_007083, partial [Xanthoria sp. 2 TBL-2021]
MPENEFPELGTIKVKIYKMENITDDTPRDYDESADNYDVGRLRTVLSEDLKNRNITQSV